MMKLRDFCEKRKKDILGQITTSELSTQLKAKEEEMIKTRRKLQEDQKCTEGEIRTKENIIKDKKKNLSREVERLEAVNRYLLGLGEEALTVALKNSCEESLKNFDIEEKIRKEFETLESSLEDAKKKARDLEKELEKLGEEINTFKYFKGDGKYEFDDEKWTAFLILNEKTPLFKPTKQKTATAYKLKSRRRHSRGAPQTQKQNPCAMQHQYMGSNQSTSSGYCINTSVDNFKAFPSVEKVLDIEEVMKKELIDIGERVKMTEPVKVKRRLLTGNDIYTSLSHNGILAIHVNRNALQFTDLNTNRQVDIKAGSWTLTGFYDSIVLLLTWREPLREATIDEVFENPTIETFRVIEGPDNVYQGTDVSLLHEQRILYYVTMDDKLFSFNVDTRENTEIDVGRRKVWLIASLAGIDCGVRVGFQDREDKCTYTLNNYNTITKVNEKQDNGLKAIFPSISSPTNIKNAVFKYCDYLMKNGNKLDTSKLIKFYEDYSVIRVYRDIFLAYDRETNSWVLIRIIVP